MNTSASLPARPLSAWQLGWRTLWRDLRAGELRLVIVAVTLAVAALTAVGFFADRLKGGLSRDARQLLGGDAVVSSDNPAPPAFAARARELGLQAVTTLGFPTMARAPDEQGGAARLVALKAVEPGYPLRGTLQVQAAQDAPAAATRDIPAPGEAWVDAGLLGALALRVGDPLLLGDAQLRIARIIAIEPDRGAGFMNFAPRVMLNEADLPATRLVQPASRLNYRFAVAGRDADVRRFVQWAEQEAAKPEVRGLRIESLDSGRPEMRQTLDRAEKFLNLVALLAALLSAVAVALAARGFAASHLDDCAMLRVLGQSQRTIATSYAMEFAVVGLGASALGVAIGYAVHFVFVLLLGSLVEASLPAPGLWPVAFGLGMGLTLLFAFGLPPVLQLAQVPPLRVIRRDVGGLKPASAAVLTVGVIGFAVLLLAASSDLKLGGIAVGGFAGAVLVFAGLSWVAVKLLRRLVNEQTAPRWLVLATRQISARPAYAVVQVSALAVGLLALVLLVLLRTDLIASWRQATPPDAPNRFVINVMPEQEQDFQKTLQAAGVKRYDWYPMIRGRLVAVNGRPVSPDDYTEDRAKRLVDREFNLSHVAQPPPHNEVVAGQWRPEEAGALSVEEGIAQTLGLQLGDVLRFDIGGVQNEARITSLRQVDWGSMRANFFVIYPVSRMPDVPSTYMGAFRAPDSAGFDNRLVRQFPNITSVDMTSTINQVQGVLDKVIRAVEFLFGFTLAAGVVVLFAAVTATREERAREFAIMRAVGAQASLLRQVQRAELAGVGLLAGFLASMVASVVGWGLARYAFDFQWTASPLVPLLGALAGAVLALAAGWWGMREVLTRPVVETLRRAAQ
ncbi:ABC transporter permease [Ramlibacter tataouinensis]|uniref:Candidate Predicted ABC type transport system involved in lysophospholipase L1 biosynthesis, permease component with duplicated domains n=1 Tax=Ramlibacter tataouinensis (strain ATCC BAA-407 / DSM 14655 / LMG 21543 / TTB310) TaxID=365046 RepID=F5XW47_RAMTT|nr:FtsX-like permease family protein [Ramlibacter tataouinensis]AEG94150.1 candidate Predicted ABC type transport system involved in lysophospholipase L1 biosynthesis, permease component with duplicated domains [Ramlibacter tataouinensis TTB310]